MGSGVAFAKGLIDEIVARANAAGDEVCGLLLGSPDHVTGVIHCRNVAPEPAIAFEIDPGQLIAAYRAARGGGPAIVGCYHSHPSGIAFPSPRDAAAAEPNGWLWLILGRSGPALFRAATHGELHDSFDRALFSPSR